MNYNTEMVTNIKREMITVNGENRPVKDFENIPEDKNNIVTAEEKRRFIDLEDQNKEVEVPNEKAQENKDDALNGGDS
jgi:hypothetical protein